jgi:DNA-binding NtrC family response regulator
MTLDDVCCYKSATDGSATGINLAESAALASEEGEEMLNVLPILVISGEGEHRERIVETIRKCGLRPTSCCSLREALPLLARQNFSTVFCNDTLPDGDFRAIIHEVRKSHADVPMVVLSRLADWDGYMTAVGAGAFDYIACPPNPAETQRILWSALSESTGLHRTAHATS